jgi:hypothetical protein
MSDSTSIFIYIVIGISLTVSVGLIGLGLWAGLTQRKDLVFWRTMKLYSSCLGLVGLLLLLVNFEKTVRDAIGGKSKEYAYAEFIDLKFFVTLHVSSVCAHEKESQEAELHCFDVKNIDLQVLSDNLRDSKPYRLIVNWQKNPKIDEFIEEVNRRLEALNRTIPVAASEESFLGTQTRINLLIISVLLVIFALAGSIGEAAYQLRQALNEASRARSTAHTE